MLATTQHATVIPFAVWQDNTLVAPTETHHFPLNRSVNGGRTVVFQQVSMSR